MHELHTERLSRVRDEITRTKESDATGNDRLHMPLDDSIGTPKESQWLIACDENMAAESLPWNDNSPFPSSPNDDDELFLAGLDRVDDSFSTEVASPQDANDPIMELETLLDHGILYHSLAHKYSQVLRMYDEDFCVIPLSGDCRNNPFRVGMSTISSYDFLLHAVMAVSTQHLAKQNHCTTTLASMHNHWSTALHLFSQSLYSSQVVPLLDALLILVSFETTQSASAMWSVHLNGAYQLLEHHGPLEKCRDNPRMRAQLAMLLWWDVTIALISRRDPRFPMEYLDSFVIDDRNDGWSFFDLNGCPLGLLVAMARLAKLASVHEQTLRMEWTMFNRSPVDAALREVKEFVNDAEVGLDDIHNLEEEANTRRNRYHCVEAWRHAIMLYACRVFTREQDPYQLRQIDHLARIILDSVRCIPKTDILQKQLLFPVFLAASEACNETDRVFVRQYCKHWSNVSRFYHFESAATVLESVWDDWSLSTRGSYWWGVKISQGAAMGLPTEVHDMALAEELLLG
ncbi:sugar transporter [Purpureocillium lavendulum]|uniref:Sugar transporter n=1 Tax=Purpureocillium lavendulum TaxID=1247861 RepID=A0AB34FUD4_9HYPO|nr:sugar transporter [Purpureocillium lavendulum]